MSVIERFYCIIIWNNGTYIRLDATGTYQFHDDFSWLTKNYNNIIIFAVRVQSRWIVYFRCRTRSAPFLVGWCPRFSSVPPTAVVFICARRRSSGVPPPTLTATGGASGVCAAYRHITIYVHVHTAVWPFSRRDDPLYQSTKSRYHAIYALHPPCHNNIIIPTYAS